MNKYLYKGFQVLYEINYNPKLNIHEAQGRIDLVDDKSSFFQEFSTQSPSSKDADHAIKRLIKHYIDFEWRQYLQN